MYELTPKPHRKNKLEENLVNYIKAIVLSDYSDNTGVFLQREQKQSD